jgi:16S rRNA processing protein RimM
MPKNDNDRLIVVGALAGAHGVRGDVRVRSFTDDPQTLFSLGPLLSEAGQPLFEAVNIRAGNDHFIVKPSRPRQKEEWDRLKGEKLFVPRSALPPPDADEFYVEDLAGLTALNGRGEQVGHIKSVQDFGAGDLLEVVPDASGASAFFVPFTLKEVPGVDFNESTVTIADPETWADQSDPRKSADQD